MLFRAGDEDTICALSTPPGTGGIAVIRVSGSRALIYVRELCRFLPEQPESHRIYYGIIKTRTGAEPIDEVLVSYFAHGRSFTGEETIEISCHGGEAVVAEILKELVAVGCRTADRGEFTYRAFMNGRLDLVQAESILALIESKSKQASRVAFRQLQGQLSAEFSKIEDGLVWMLAQLEASIDFSTEDIEVVGQKELMSRAEDLLAAVGKLISSYEKGRLLKDGVEIALIGRPNVGKSSLLNLFLGEDRAIVTAHAGTTRDTIEGRMMLEGFPVTFVDTAGFRETDNEIEKLGIQRSVSAKERADFVFHVFDIGAAEDELLRDLSELPSPLSERDYIVVNKIDLDADGGRKTSFAALLERFSIWQDRVFWISAKSQQGLDAVLEFLRALRRSFESESSNVVTQARHLELLRKIQSSLKTAKDLIIDSSSPEFVAFELQEAVRAIHELLGKEFDEQVIDRIFKEFCLGK